MNDNITEINKQRKRGLITERTEWLDRMVEDWKQSKDRILTDDKIDALRTIALKNLDYRENKQNLTQNVRAQKTDIHQKLRNGFLDIVRMINMEMMGPNSKWNPYCHDDRVDRLPYDVNTWREDFKAYDVGQFVECLVSMFGDDYAIPIADAIRRGLEANDGFDSKFEVDVPVIKRSKRTSP
jgi:hypothetical protein